MSVYLDASVLVSLFIRDAHSDWVEAWLTTADETRFVSSWGVTEFSSALGLRRRLGALDAASRASAELSLDAWLQVATIQIDPVRADFAAARTLIRSEQLPLKGPDALHLAIAIRIGAELVTLDRQLRSAGRDIGIVIRAP